MKLQNTRLKKIKFMIHKTKRAIAYLGATLITLAIGKPASAILFNSSTGHYYEFVPGGYTWTQAKALAENRSYKGLQGYLATITSGAEQNFIISRLGFSDWGGWIGASDAAADGIWKWVTGPEAGRVFWQNGRELGYNNFHPGEPNELLNSTEDYAHIWKHGGGTWNDLPNDVAQAWGWKHPEANSVGYYVEYGGIKLETVPTLESFLLNSRNGNINIFEGQSVSATLSASDRDGDNLDFYVNNNKVSTRTPSASSGSASTTVPLGLFRDDGSYTQRAQVKDEDGRRSQTITRTVNVQNVAPTLNFNLSNPIINEGDSAFAQLFATDPGADAISFFLNDENIGTDTRTSGNRFVSTNLGIFADDGIFTYTGKAEDDDGGISNILARTLTVNNLDPTITSLTENLTIGTNTTFDFAATATDPGINDILTFDWDLDGDGLFNDFTGSSGEWSFSNSGLYAMNVRVSDGDGGFAYGSFEVEAVTTADESVPEPGSVFGLLTLGALGVGSRLRKRKF